MSAAMVSCVDDEESTEVKEMRQAQLEQMKADLDQTYWNMYNSAISKVKTLENEKKTVQNDLDDVKSGKLTLEDAKTAIIDWNNIRIAQAKKDIEDEEAVKEIYEKMDIKSAEELREEEINAEIEMKKAYTAKYTYWAELTNNGYNYNNISAEAYWNSKLNELLNSKSDYYGFYTPSNHKLQGSAFIQAAASVFYNDNSYFSFYDSYSTSPSYSTYYMNDIFDLNSKELKDDNVTYYTYYYYTINTEAYNEYLNTLKTNTDSLQKRLLLGDNSVEDTFNTYKEKKDSVEAKYKTLNSTITAYNTLRNTLEGFAKEVYALEIAYNKAENIYLAYSYNGMDKEELVMQCEKNINTLKNNIVEYNENIETANNDIVDNATLTSYYNTLISNLESDIQFQKSMAEKYRNLLGSSTSSSSESSTPATTTEE